MGVRERLLALSVAIGAPAGLVKLSVDDDGVPTALLVLPRGKYKTDYGTFNVTEKALKRVLAAWEKRGLPIPVDYEHQSAQDPPVVAPAAGLAQKLEIRKEGLVATSIKWTARAKSHLKAADGEAAEYNFHSPVFYYDPKTMEPTALRSIALTNEPASHNQEELRAQVAARIENEQRAAMAAGNSVGGTMKDLITQLRYTLGMRLTDTLKDLRVSLTKILNAIPDTDDMIAELRAGEAEGEAAEDGDETKALTLLSILGLVANEEVERMVAARASAQPIAAPEVLALLGLEKGADLAALTAAVITLKNPADMVPRAEHEKALTRIAELDEKAAASRIDELVTANRTRITPAIEASIREIAKTNWDLAVLTVAKLPEQKPEQVAKQPAPAGVAEVTTPSSITLRGQELEVDMDSATLVARVEAHQKASMGKLRSYGEAFEDLKRNGGV